MSTQTLSDQGFQALQQADYGTAAALFRRSLDDDELDADAHEGLATASFMLKDYETAVAHFQRVTEIDPRRHAAIINLGAVYNRMGQFQKAIDVLRRGVQLSRNSAEGFYNLGYAHRQLKQHSLAIPAYREAIRINPQMADAYQNLGNVYLEMGNSQQAINYYKKALEINPRFERALRGLERAQSAIADERRAESPFGRLVDEKQLAAANQETSFRVLGEQDRQRDRELLLKLAQDADKHAREFLDFLRSELDPCTRALARTMSQSGPPAAAAQAFREFDAARAGFSMYVKRLSRVMQQLRDHESRLRS